MLHLAHERVWGDQQWSMVPLVISGSVVSNTTTTNVITNSSRVDHFAPAISANSNGNEVTRLATERAFLLGRLVV